jgi:hypothetical protein
MKANKFLLSSAAFILMSAAANTAWAQLSAADSTKVNGALSKKWSESKGNNDKQPVNPKQIVNIGSKKNGGCSDVNIGSVVGKRKPGEKAPKEIVVTAKDVINICK